MEINLENKIMGNQIFLSFKSWIYWSVNIFFSILIPWGLIVIFQVGLTDTSTSSDLMWLLNIAGVGLILSLLHWFYLRKIIDKAWIWASLHGFLFIILASAMYIWKGVGLISLQAQSEWIYFAIPALIALVTNFILNSSLQFFYFRKNKSENKKWWILPLFEYAFVAILGIILIQFFKNLQPSPHNSELVLQYIILFLYIGSEALMFTLLQFPLRQEKFPTTLNYLHNKFIVRFLTWFKELELTCIGIVFGIIMLSPDESSWTSYIYLSLAIFYFCWREWYVFRNLI